MKHATLSKAEQVNLFKQFSNAMQTAKEYGFTVEEIASLIGLTPRTLFRILAKTRPVEHSDIIQIQTVALTVLKLHNKMLDDPNFTLRKVKY